MASTVLSYLEMLRLEVSGQQYVKSRFREALLPLVDPTRTESAIEFKHQNISAVLMKLGLRPIRGYQPAKNYQQSLVPEVQRQLASDPSLVELILAEALRAPAAPIGALDFSSASTPAIIFPERSKSTFTTGGRPDYAAIEARNRALGLAGELAVADLEYRRLVKAGKNKLAGRIEHVSQTRGDGDGFDILSFEEGGQERLIEVKTTRSRAETPFFVSSNELKVSREHAHFYHLIRVFDFEHEPAWFPLSGSLDASCVLEPNDFMALPRPA